MSVFERFLVENSRAAMAMTVSDRGCVEIALQIFGQNGINGNIARVSLICAEKETAS
jgi:hypothetical protein